ncbi:hypothetical protein [Paenibacillus agricola]|uniref:hypothetical protein n=1 Tax=Paenibacillus agricola TaxID=2716264 RepID=UPI001A9F8501|nr:hypothetical protein [Paenibacillus agricola]
MKRKATSSREPIARCFFLFIGNITQLTDMEKPPLRLLNRQRCCDYAKAAQEARAESDGEWRHLSESVSFTS